MSIFAAWPRPIVPSTAAVAVANNFRVASISIAAYDYLITLPAEFRLYKKSGLRSLGVIQFILIRYTSMAIIIIANINFFDHHFSPEVCARYSYVGPIFKVFQIMVSQAILGIRAYQIADKRVWVGPVLVFAYIAAVAVQWVTDIYNRIPVMINNNCLTTNARPQYVISAWTFYFVAMLFDTLALSISTVYLLKKKPKVMPKSYSSNLLKILLFDGLGYFVALTGTNLINIFLFRGGDFATSTAGTSLGYAMTWIMSQRILLHPREADVKRTSVAAQLSTVSPLRSGVGRMSSLGSAGSTKVDSQDNSHTQPPEPVTDIKVFIERSVIKESKPANGESSDGVTHTASRSVSDRDLGYHV